MQTEKKTFVIKEMFVIKRKTIILSHVGSLYYAEIFNGVPLVGNCFGLWTEKAMEWTDSFIVGGLLVIYLGNFSNLSCIYGNDTIV